MPSRAATFTVTGQDAFVPYDAAGRRVPCAAITVHFLTRTLAEDKDGTPPPPRFKVTIDSVRVSCP
ncbi:MAG: hypothetical protein ACJ77Z_15330 [Thermoleophilaceae bacterium]